MTASKHERKIGLGLINFSFIPLNKIVEIIALDGAQHLKPGKVYSVLGSMALSLINKGFADLHKQ